MLAITLDTPDVRFGNLVAMDRGGWRFLAAGIHGYVYARSVSPIYGAPDVWTLEAALEAVGDGAISAVLHSMETSRWPVCTATS